jgi:hypothetical protein
MRKNIFNSKLNFYESIPTKTKLEITLRFLAIGESYSLLQYSFRVPKCSISEFAPYVFALNPKNILRKKFRTTNFILHVRAGTDVNASTPSKLISEYHGSEYTKKSD